MDIAGPLGTFHYLDGENPYSDGRSPGCPCTVPRGLSIDEERSGRTPLPPRPYAFRDYAFQDYAFPSNALL